MKRMVSSAVAFSLFFLLTSPNAQAATDFPTKPIRIVVPAAPGGALDLTTRLVAEKMSEDLGQTIIVDNRPGAGSLIGTRYVKTAKADGYTLLSQANGFTLLPQTKINPGYDPAKDFTGIGFMTRSPLVIETSTTQPEGTLQDFMARVKANPGQLSYGHGGVSTPIHLAAASFLHKTGLNMLSVPYKGNGPVLLDVIGNRLHLVFDGYISSAPFIGNGQLRPLAVTSDKRMESLKDVPTLKEQGVDFSYTLWLGLLAPSGVPNEVVNRLSQSLKYALESKELNKRFIEEGSDPTFVTPAFFTDYYKNEAVDMVKVAADLQLPRD
ncbi:Bug family tripartite tricarboxylate transporter substrate binding protein [Advenella mimigardefordensis]|uniref:Putative Bug-like extracytoplasmic solute binding receptor, TTT family n=1 Tax=Advenella mimigardefordensis (strain DSM 17166 / LMG 22922 / DPN7) TaxID=1247726 RepID=W0PG91_ADVMD|nr:tripartite tricarboxylate transporter substrate binding protein [Advenella mimigardefordensis]AHG64118.1 putative Bug-like extracytoplasmic solute binding receptor, TTT family [Advenella mimigardefordensis DPN7]